MNPQFKRTLILVGTSTAIGFVGDLLTYSVAASKGGALRIVSPKGKELLAVILIGVVGGYILDSILKGIENSLKNQEEKDLDALVDKEKARIISGEIVNQTPNQVVWIKTA